MGTLLIALAIFLVTFPLISIRRFPRFKVDRPAAALIGAALMILFGVVGARAAIDAINMDIIILLGDDGARRRARALRICRMGLASHDKVLERPVHVPRVDDGDNGRTLSAGAQRYYRSAFHADNNPDLQTVEVES